MQADDPLAGLRALHLPREAYSAWSDVGFAAAAGLALALLAFFAIKALYRPRLSLRKATLAAFENAKTLPTGERRVAQAAILRRVVKSVEGDDASHATGPDWSTTLDRVFATDFFSTREGKVFADGLYGRPSPAANDDGIDAELGRLLARLKG